VRAYGGAARDCLRAAPKAFVKRRAALRAVAPFASLGAVYAAVSRAGGSPAGEERYTEAGDVEVTFLVDADVADGLVEAVANATSGRVVPEVVAAPGGDGGDAEGGGDG
jgi:putative IMPACT (imprinted ancient) family translation regulator